MNTILLTGKHGQLGFELQRSLAPLGQVVAVDALDCDLSDAAAVRALLERVQPDIIVNPAAYTAVDKAETDAPLAWQINAEAPAIMAAYARAHAALLVHYSTDYVFDGSQPGWYRETDVPNPQSVYGQSKLAGERAVQACERHLIMRTSWVVGAHGGNFLKTILRLARERTELRVVADQWGAPTPASLLADCTAHLLRRYRQQGEVLPYGLYHVAAAGETSWHEYACYVVRQALANGMVLALRPEAIQPIPAHDYPLPAPRPANSRLDTHTFRATFDLHLPHWQQGIQHILTQLTDAT
jgi:dTDP-4-dehydrorhamnose reductase